MIGNPGRFFVWIKTGEITKLLLFFKFLFFPAGHDQKSFIDSIQDRSVA